MGSRGAQQLRNHQKKQRQLFQYLGSRGAQRQTPSAAHQRVVSILGLARSPTQSDQSQKRIEGFNTWAREEPNQLQKGEISAEQYVSILGLARSPTTILSGGCSLRGVSILGLARSPTGGFPRIDNCQVFQYLGSRGAQHGGKIIRAYMRDVSILGLARSPTGVQKKEKIRLMFQYLGSRGAQPGKRGELMKAHLFQYLGSRGAQHMSCYHPLRAYRFQYLGSRGAQHARSWALRVMHVSILGLARSPTYCSPADPGPGACFNTWAREEPNLMTLRRLLPVECVSILGLARSPTNGSAYWYSHKPFQYLGSRGAQLDLLERKKQSNAVSILGLARSPT